MRSPVFSAVLFLICLMSATQVMSQTYYTYRNANGRMVTSTQPSPGARIMNPSRTSQTGYDQSILSYCRQKWGQDFEMTEYCMKNQQTAKRALSRYPQDILDFCGNKWGSDYEMLEYCSKNQYAAQQRIGN